MKLRENDPIVLALLAEAEGHELLAKAARIRAAAAITTRPDDDEEIDAKRSLAEFGIGRDGLKNAEKLGELKLKRGVRQKITVTRGELRRWKESRPNRASPPKLELVAQNIEDFDPLEAALKSGRLRATR